MYTQSDYADYYRVAGFKILSRGEKIEPKPPPYLIEPPTLATYEWRGARMLNTANYKGKCFRCAYANMSGSSVETIS